MEDGDDDVSFFLRRKPDAVPDGQRRTQKPRVSAHSTSKRRRATSSTASSPNVLSAGTNASRSVSPASSSSRDGGVFSKYNRLSLEPGVEEEEVQCYVTASQQELYSFANLVKASKGARWQDGELEEVGEAAWEAIDAGPSLFGRERAAASDGASGHGKRRASPDHPNLPPAKTQRTWTPAPRRRETGIPRHFPPKTINALGDSFSTTPAPMSHTLPVGSTKDVVPAPLDFTELTTPIPLFRRHQDGAKLPTFCLGSSRPGRTGDTTKSQMILAPDSQDESSELDDEGLAGNPMCSPVVEVRERTSAGEIASGTDHASIRSPPWSCLRGGTEKVLVHTNRPDRTSPIKSPSGCLVGSNPIASRRKDGFSARASPAQIAFGATYDADPLSGANPVPSVGRPGLSAPARDDSPAPSMATLPHRLSASNSKTRSSVEEYPETRPKAPSAKNQSDSDDDIPFHQRTAAEKGKSRAVEPSTKRSLAQIIFSDEEDCDYSKRMRAGGSGLGDELDDIEPFPGDGLLRQDQENQSRNLAAELFPSDDDGRSIKPIAMLVRPARSAATKFFSPAATERPDPRRQQKSKTLFMPPSDDEDNLDHQQQLDRENRNVVLDRVGDRQSKEEQLKRIGLVVGNSPLSEYRGLAPLMDTWTKADRDKILSLAGLGTKLRAKRSAQDGDDMNGPSGAASWNGILKPDKPAAKPRSKTWATRGFWRKGRGRGKAPGRGRGRK